MKNIGKTESADFLLTLEKLFTEAFEISDVNNKISYYGNPIVFRIISNNSIKGEVNLL